MDLREDKFQNFPRGACPRTPPSVPAPFCARSYFSRINSALLPPGLELYATYRLKNNYLDISITVLKISEININLLPNTCNFHRNFRLIFSLHLSENVQNVHFREAKFQNFPGEHAPGAPTSLLAPSAVDTIWARLALNCFRRAGYFQSVILTMILRVLRTQKGCFFSH